MQKIFKIMDVVVNLKTFEIGTVLEIALKSRLLGCSYALVRSKKNNYLNWCKFDDINLILKDVNKICNKK